MGKFVLWCLGLAVAVAMLGPGRSHAPVVSAAAVASPVQAAAEDHAGNGIADTVLTRARDGHFYADAMVNGAPVHFLVDTGASSVALTRADAQAAGVQFAAGDFTESGRSASGAVALKPVTLDRVAIGPVEAHAVDAVVVDGDLNISLLGQSWLARVGRVEIEDDRMTLR